MKVLFLLFLAVVSACAFSIESKPQDIFRDVEPVIPGFDPETRITNGKPANITDYPWQVGLIVGRAWCGGSLISETHILTAAHCVEGLKSASRVTAYLGSADRQKGIRRVGRAIKIHPGWNSRTVLNDIALITIDAVPLSANIQKATLPAITGSYSTYSGDTAIASGWGKTSDSSGVASTLQAAEVTIINNTVCARTYGSTVKPSNICIATPGGVSTCNGDSGGPLILKSTEELIGITSFGARAGCTLGYPAAFTRTTSYRTWISDNAGV